MGPLAGVGDPTSGNRTSGIWSTGGRIAMSGAR
ncbi:hypothetical protein ACNKHM_24990 [Shigella sonnei]